MGAVIVFSRWSFSDDFPTDAMRLCVRFATVRCAESMGFVGFLVGPGFRQCLVCLGCLGRAPTGVVLAAVTMTR